MSNTAQAIVFDAPQQLSIKTLEVKAFEANDIEVDVTFSGISTGTERLLWDGSMPPFPGLGYPLVPGYETVGEGSIPAGYQIGAACAFGRVSSSRTSEIAPSVSRFSSCRLCSAFTCRRMNRGRK